MWREALFAASQAPLSVEELDVLSLDLAETLLEAKNYSEAATIHLDYRNDVAEAARILCKGCYFGEAMRVVCIDYGRLGFRTNTRGRLGNKVNPSY